VGDYAALDDEATGDEIHGEFRRRRRNAGRGKAAEAVRAKRKRLGKAGRLEIQSGMSQAATFVGLTSRSLLELAIGIERRFTSGISRTRSTCSSPFCRLALVGELEATLEGQRGDALIEHVGGLFLGAGLLLTADGQSVLLRLDSKISIGETGDCDRDAIGVLTGPLDIVARIVRRSFHAIELVEHGEQSKPTVER
jgi:hypothetical protein